MQPHQRVLVVVGGASGIGYASAQLFHQRGDRVVILGRRATQLKLMASKHGFDFFAMDAVDPAQCGHAIAVILHKYHRIDHLICSAGQMSSAKVDQVSALEWQVMLNNNLNSAAFIAKAALPALIESHGSLVFIASLASLFAGKSVCAYTTTKHAIIGLMRSIARDYGEYMVRANAICPGWVMTPMADEEMQPLMLRRQLSLQQAYAYVTQHVPLRRAATADEIAHICWFLCSEAASIITGAVICADGGASIVDVPTLAFDE